MKDKSWHFYLPAMILLLILWYVISIIVHLPIIPSPVLVMERLGNIFTQTIMQTVDKYDTNISVYRFVLYPFLTCFS